ncbi:MAG TPA: TIGR03790 family protein [Sedimentisphaerales bacterium]|nr:TIGR03790 family protein [Sedimentisphaerales bacterium]
MMFKNVAAIALILLGGGIGFALEPDEILVIANRQISASERIAEYYCEKRKIPKKNIIYLALGYNPREGISRDEYERSLALPIRRALQRRFPDEIRCLVTTYGIPIKVGSRGLLPGMGGKLNELKLQVSEEKQKLEQLEKDPELDQVQVSTRKKQINEKIARMQLEIDRISGKETNASVDSELSMVLFQPYDLYRWQPNMLRGDVLGLGFRTLMVSRLDGPSYEIIKGLIDKALTAEETGLKGIAYIDSRGFKQKDLYGYFDQSLRDLAAFIRSSTKMPIKAEQTGQLFMPGSCPQTAVYCGWYSVKKYVDAFDFVDGAVGFHIASFEAQQLRDPNSNTWCPAMLTDGITATLGAVNEPYLHAFPPPNIFFAELIKGGCLVEAYYYSKPFNSWQFVLIGDPLYRPFKKSFKKE